MSAFLRQVLATMAGVFLLGLILLFILVNSFPQTDLPLVEEQSVLVLDLALPVVDDPVPTGLSALFGQAESVAPWPLYQLLAGLQLAADDPNIVGLHLVAGVGDTGWANLREIRQALQGFRASGKKLSCYFPYYDERALYISSLCDQAYIPPFSDLELNGFLAELHYFRKAFDRYGIEVQVTRVGKYKSAVEPYLLEEMSPANREQIETLLQQNFDLVLQEIATSFASSERGQLDFETLQSLVQERGVLTSSEAVELGFLDGERYQEQVSKELRKWTDEDPESAESRYDFRQIWFDDYLAAEYEDESRVDGATVAVIYAEGEIIGGGSMEQVGGEYLAERLEEARLDDGIAAVVLRVDSPGGSASASEVILHQVELLAAEKPVVVSMGNVAASGGYWISSLAHEIYAQPNTITGSIGVFGMLPNVAKLAEKLGVRIETVQTGPHANLYSIVQSKSPATMQRLQVSVDEVYEGFLQRVATGRDLEPSAVHEIAQGRIWTGQAALDLQLLDHLGGLADATNRAAELAGLVDGHATEHWTYDADEWELMLADLLQDTDSPWASIPTEFTQALKHLKTISDRRGIYARLPFQLKIF